MDLKQMKHFVVLAETLNFNQAAQKLYISQPPLSISIRKLEESLGVALFERTTRQVKLTEYGVLILPDIQQALKLIEIVKFKVKQSTRGIRGTLRIGSVASATISLIPKIIPIFKKLYPEVDLIIRDYPSEKIVEYVEMGDLDVGLVRSPIMSCIKSSSVLIEQDTLVAVVPHDLFPQITQSIHLKSLAQHPFINYSKKEASGLNFAVNKACQNAGFIPRTVQETTQILATISLVEAGLGVALVPSLHINPQNRQVKFFQISDHNIDLTIGLSLIFDPANETETIRAFRSIAENCHV